MLLGRIVEVKVTSNKKQKHLHDLWVRYCVFSDSLKSAHTEWVPIITALPREIAVDCALSILETNLYPSPENLKKEDSETLLEIVSTGKLQIWKFIDADNVECSIQKASIDSEDFIWFGVDSKRTELSCPSRMRLTRAHVKELLPLLLRFVATGDILREEALKDEPSSSLSDT